MNKITSIYKKLTPKEQAILAFQAAANEDFETADMISGAIPMETYKTKHKSFHEVTLSFTGLALSFGAQYWKLSTYLLRAAHSNDLEAVKAFFAQLSSLWIALDTVCKECKIDPLIIKKMALCDDEPLLTGYFQQPELIEKYLNDFRKLIND